MHRVALFLELTDDEAAKVIEAVSAIDVWFGGVTLGQLLEGARTSTAAALEGAAVLHTARSEGAAAAGEPVFEAVRRKRSEPV